jgi:hypothetical protein
MTDCLIGCITSDDAGRGYYCEECPLAALTESGAQTDPLTEDERQVLRGRLAEWFGDDRQSFLVSHLAPVVEHIAADRALEMSRQVEQEQRRAEDAEAEVERLRERVERTLRLIDSWEHDAPDHSNPVFIGRLRECLRRDPAPVRLRGGQR